jgi:hypothetical protein
VRSPPLSFSPSLPPSHHTAHNALFYKSGWSLTDRLDPSRSLALYVSCALSLSHARARALSLSLLPSALCEKLSLFGTWPDFEPFRLSRLYDMGFRVRKGPLGAWVSVTLCPR